MTQLIAVDGLKMYFYVRSGLFKTTTVRAVDGVTLSARRGETVGLVGESGSGKTTLGRAMLRLIEPTDGRIFFDDADVLLFKGTELRRFRRRAQAVFQDPYSSISPYMNVHEIVEEPMVIHGYKLKAERTERLNRALEQVKLTPVREIESKYPHNLSGGQRQRVCIARALVLQPEFLIADEPVSMVDASNRAEILYLLRALQEEQGITFFYITHDIASARYFSDRIAVMYLGTIVELAPSQNIILEPLHPYTHGLLAAVPEPDPKNRIRLRPVIPGEPPSAAQTPQGCPFNPRCSHVIKGRCDQMRPSLKEVVQGHMVACYLHA